MTKIFIILASFLLVSPKLFAQNQEEKLLMEEYIRQSENQRKTGLILLGAGLGAVAIGSAIGGMMKAHLKLG